MKLSTKGRYAVMAMVDLACHCRGAPISLADIAQAANLELSDLRREFSCKSDIIRAFQRETDSEVLAKTRPAGETQSPRDRVFDIVMTRFEVMQPYKPALKRIWGYLCCRPGEAAVVLCSSLASQYWMLAGAGAKLDGPGGALRVTGLASIYAKVFQVWLGDTSPAGMRRSCGIMVNYVYRLAEVEHNHEQYVNKRRVLASKSAEHQAALGAELLGAQG